MKTIIFWIIIIIISVILPLISFKIMSLKKDPCLKYGREWQVRGGNAFIPAFCVNEKGERKWL